MTAVWSNTCRLPPVSTKGVQNVSVLKIWVAVLIINMGFVPHFICQKLPVLMHNRLGLQGWWDWEVGLGHTLKPWEKHNYAYHNDDITIKMKILLTNLRSGRLPSLEQWQWLRILVKSAISRCVAWSTPSYSLTSTTRGSLGQAAGSRQLGQVTPVAALVWSILAKNSSQLFVELLQTLTNFVVTLKRVIKAGSIWRTDKIKSCPFVRHATDLNSFLMQGAKFTKSAKLQKSAEVQKVQNYAT